MKFEQTSLFYTVVLHISIWGIWSFVSEGISSPKPPVTTGQRELQFVNSRGWSSLHVVFSQTRNYGNCIYWCKYSTYATSMAQRKGWKRRFRIDRSDSLHLPVLSLLCTWARRLKMRKAHLTGPSILHVVHPFLLKIAPREMKHAFKLHVPLCLYLLYRICELWLYMCSTVRCTHKCSL